jgi:hypothetical protein
MRKTAASVLLFGLFLLPHFAFAQSSNWIGPRLGLNMANESFTGGHGVSSSMKFAPFGGIEFDHIFDETWMVTSGLVFNQKGSNQSYTASDASNTGSYDGKDNFTLSYIEIPIIAKMMFGNGDAHPYVYVGPSINILMSASEDADGTVPKIADVKSAANTTEVALNFGGGLSVLGGSSSRIFFEAGYSAGLTAAFKSNPSRSGVTDATNFVDLSTAKSGDIRIAIGMLWQL